MWDGARRKKHRGLRIHLLKGRAQVGPSGGGGRDGRTDRSAFTTAAVVLPALSPPGARILANSASPLGSGRGGILPSGVSCPTEFTPALSVRVSSPPPGARLPNALVSAGSSHGLRPRWAPLLLSSQVPGSTPPSLASAVLHAMHVSSSPLSSRHTSPVTCLVALCHLQAVRQHAIPSAYFTPPLAPPLTARSSPLRTSPIAPHPLAKPCVPVLAP